MFTAARHALRSAWTNAADRVSGRVRTRSILQMEALECGAASLAMILAHHGRWASPEELRLRCGVSRDGTKAGNILRAARHYGLAAKGFRKEPEELLSLPIPSIIHWNFNHFIVFEGIVGRWAYVNDPALGPGRISLAELSESFTGVVLAFEKTADFATRRAPPEFLAAMRARLQGSWHGLVLVCLASLLLVVPGVVTPVFGKIFVDDLLIGGLHDWLRPLLLGMAATAALRAAALWLQAHFLTRLEAKLELAMASRFVWHLLRLPIVFFTQRHAGDIANRVAANDDIARLLSGGLATTALSLCTAVLFAAVMAMVNIGLAAVAVPIVLLNAVAVRLAARARGSAAQRLMKDRSQLSGNTVGLIRSIEGIKAGGAEQDTFARWAGYHAKTMASQRDFDRRTALIGMVPPLLAGIGSAALLGVGSLEVIAGRISVGDLVAFLALAAAFADPVTQIVGLSSTLQEVKAGAARVRDVLAYAPDPRFARDAEQLQAAPAERHSSSRLSGAIELRDVTFGYNLQEPPLIEGFDLTVAPGMRLALVGASGSGKSTLGRLICGLHAPWSGAVLFDGVPAAEISRSVMANSLAYVDQDVFLFQGSVAENVALWDRSVSESEISRALKDAAIFEEIAVRPGRIGAPVLEGGGNFSGGQRQRLEIARALTNDPAILVLDEAMAALDPVVEQEIDDNIRRRGCTCIIIAHRLSTIRDCDEIIMLEGGRAIGRGRHEDLLATCPEYRRMIDAQ